MIRSLGKLDRKIRSTASLRCGAGAAFDAKGITPLPESMLLD